VNIETKIKFAAYLKRVAFHLKRFLYSRKVIGKLPRVDIAVFDTHTADHLCKVLEGYSVYTIDIRGESYHLTILLKSILKYFLLRGKKQLLELYWSTFINDLGARICITHQDANAIFFDLARESRGTRFIALQQGLKNAATIANYKKICGDYFAYGSAYADKLRNGEAKIYVSGSVKSNNSIFELGKKTRLSYVSSYVGHPLELKILGNYNYAEFSYPSIYSSLRFVEEFCRRNIIDLVIVSKSFRERTQTEREHVLQNEITTYRNVIGRDVKIIAGDSYKVAGESRLIVCDQSALGYELLGRGCKVVFLNFISFFLHSPSHGFGWPLELPSQGPFWSNIPDPVFVGQMLEKVWHMSPDEWNQVTRDYKEKLMFYDPENSILLGHLRELLGKSKNRPALAGGSGSK